MNYQQTLDYLFSRLPMFSRIGAAAIKADLHNTVRICSFLGDPQDHFKSIHIGGTNGKGSTSHMLASVFQSAGYKTGLYTSPHIHDFRERIKVNGEMIPESFVMEFTSRLQGIIEEIHPSFFEITVGMAFEYFRVQQVDIAIIEVGLGGRLDSTNIITPELSVITNIGLDHTNILGNTLQLIAFEKAGIIKNNIPVVIGEVLPETEPVFEKAASERKAPIFYAERKMYAAGWTYDHGYLEVLVDQHKPDSRNSYKLDLPGVYQVKNLVTVLESINQLRLLGWKLDDQALANGLSHVKKLTGLHGRWETVSHNPRVITDVAHNAAGFRQLRAQLELTDYHHLHLVVGMARDKDVDSILDLIPTTATCYFTQANIPRALPAAELQAMAALKHLKGNTFDNVNMAVKAAVSSAHPDDLVLVCGSVYIISELN